MTVNAEDILRFWFEDSAPADWYAKNPAFDAAIRERFLTTHLEAATGALDGWREDGPGCLALCLLLDQFPRNMFRRTARAFATDAQALAVTRHALEHGFDADPGLDDARRAFLYIPLEHSENLADQRLCLELATTRMNDPQFVSYVRQHLEIIERFGRFPHRNEVLGRKNTPEEEAFLGQKGSGF